MDFFQRQDQARRNTKWLALYFILAIAGITLAIYLVIAFFAFGRRIDPDTLWNPRLFGLIALGTLTVVFFGSFAKTIALRGGGGAVAMMLGGIPLDRSSRGGDDQKLLNVVEEMAIASGIPVPEVYVLDKEQGINAFAAGHTPNDAAIGVTRGCMKLLNRDELQGVIAHEFSHILNGDMRLNLRLIGLVHGILCIALIGRGLMRIRGGKKNPAPLVGLALFIVGWIGVFFGNLIKSAVSRQREFLADASAVQFTRNPEGLAGALKKIGGYDAGSKLDNEHAEEASHMFFSNGLDSAWTRLMATHPPLEDRIRLLDPTFDGKYPHVVVAEPEGWNLTAQFGGKRISEKGAVNVRVVDVITDVGTPRPAHIVYAAEFLDELPQELHAAAHEPMAASALIYALLLSPTAEVRMQQLHDLEPQIAPPIYKETLRLNALISPLPLTFKLPLLSLALPTLANLSAQQYELFSANIKLLVECDKEVDLFEYTLQKMAAHHLKTHFQPAPPRPIQYYAVRSLLPDCAVLLSALAHLGHEDDAGIKEAFYRGTATLNAALQFVDLSACGLPEIDVALDRLAQASPAIKKIVLNACAETVASDGVIQPGEAELLRAIAETLECPIPPFVQGV